MNRINKVTIKPEDASPLLFHLAILVIFYSTKVAHSHFLSQKPALSANMSSGSECVSASETGVVPSSLRIFFLCKNFKLLVELLQFSREGVSIQTNPRTAISWINLHFDKNPEPVVYMLQVLDQLQKDANEYGKPFVSNCFDTMQNYRLHCNEENI